MTRHHRDRFRSRLIIHLIILALLSFFLPLYGRAGTVAGQVDDFRLHPTLENLLADHPGKSGGYILEKGAEALLARAWLAEHATSSINVQYFIWSTDNIGILAAEALLRAAQRGVKVRVLVDDLLIDAPDKSMLALSAHTNLDIRIYNPKNSVGTSQPERIANLALDFRAFNQRMHDKTFMVDGSVGITGGRNMADEYFDYDHEYNFRDRDILVMGPVVEAMEANFELFWNSPLAVPVDSLLERGAARLTQKEIDSVYDYLTTYAASPENFAPEVRESLADMQEKFPGLITALVWDDIRFVCDMPGKNAGGGFSGGGRSTTTLVDALSSARKSVVIQTPYLIMPQGGIDFFKKLVDAGVEVMINTNSLASTDNLQAFSGYRKQRKRILQAGIKVFEFRPEPAIQKVLVDRYAALEKSPPVFAIHAKSMVIDNETVFVGTFNFDPRSANLNTEVGALIKNSQLAHMVEHSILTDMLPENSWNASIHHPDRHAPMWKRLKVKFWELMPITKLL